MPHVPRVPWNRAKVRSLGHIFALDARNRAKSNFTDFCRLRLCEVIGEKYAT